MSWLFERPPRACGLAHGDERWPVSEELNTWLARLAIAAGLRMLLLVPDPTQPALYLILNPFVRTAPNMTVEVDLEIQRISWEGDVTLSVTRVPDGISASLEPTVTSGDTATLTLEVGSVAPGSYDIELLATGATGLTTAAVVFLTVTDPEG